MAHETYTGVVAEATPKKDKPSKKKTIKGDDE
jgi:hypothetical protein